MAAGASSQVSAQNRFAWVATAAQSAIVVLFLLLVRYEESAESNHLPNQLGQNGHLREQLEKYPLVLDVHMMLFGGFGLLMTFLKRYAFSAIGMTMFLTVLATEWYVVLSGMLKMGDDFVVGLDLIHLLEGGVAAAAVLITFGAVLGKLNPLQLLAVCLVETTLFTANAHIGYSVLGTADVGGAIFVHAFGAYFGLALAWIARPTAPGRSNHRESSVYISDVSAAAGTIILWVFWPSFNGALASTPDALHRAILNTYLSLAGSTVAAFVISSLYGERYRLDMVDIQNATLAGGVAVGAVADLMLQPYGALVAGTVVGIISTLGFKKLQEHLHQRFGLHDTCGVHNLHGLPGVASGLLSVVMCGLASADNYGPGYYLLFPRATPPGDSEAFKAASEMLPSLEAGGGRTAGQQAGCQMLALVLTLIVALTGGALTGILININSLFAPLNDQQLFDDSHAWALPDEEENDADGRHHSFDSLEAVPSTSAVARNRNKVMPSPPPSHSLQSRRPSSAHR